MGEKKYLYDHTKGHGELTPGIWISVKSVQTKALYFETLLTEYGALYDKLPLSAFVWKTDFDPEDQLPLDVLELWDSFDYNITVVRKPLLGRCEFFGKDKKMHAGNMNLQSTLLIQISLLLTLIFLSWIPNINHSTLSPSIMDSSLPNQTIE